MEKNGIITAIVTRDGFAGLVENAFAGEGFSPEAPQAIFPAELFLPESNLNGIQEKTGELIGALTTWEPRHRSKGIVTPARIKVRSSSCLKAIKKFNDLFLFNQWGDGLPLAPPTEEDVERVLTGTDFSPQERVGKVHPRGCLATVHDLAIAMAMTGGRPEYMPVFIAAVQAILDQRFHHDRMNTTTCSVAPVVVVNGHAARDIRLNSGYGCLGPDPAHPAGACIGRAIRLILMNLGGTVPGRTTMSIYGGPSRYTGLVFAEDEAGLPRTWRSLRAEQGFPEGTNTVTAYAVSGVSNVPGGEASSQESLKATLHRAAGAMGVPNGNYWVPGTPYQANGKAGMLLMGRKTAQGLADSGWSKGDVQKFLWEHAKVPLAKLGPRFETWWFPDRGQEQDPMPICQRPEGICLIVAGGEHSGHMMWMQVGCCPEGLVSREVALPSRWNQLVHQSEQELGPVCSEAGCFLSTES